MFKLNDHYLCSALPTEMDFLQRRMNILLTDGSLLRLLGIHFRRKLPIIGGWEIIKKVLFLIVYMYSKTVIIVWPWVHFFEVY